MTVKGSGWPKWSTEFQIIIPNKFLCKVGLIRTNELLNLESEFLSFVDFNLFIEDSEFFKYKNKLDNLYQIRIAINNEEKNKTLMDIQNGFKLMGKSN